MFMSLVLASALLVSANDDQSVIDAAFSRCTESAQQSPTQLFVVVSKLFRNGYVLAHLNERIVKTGHVKFTGVQFNVIATPSDDQAADIAALKDSMRQSGIAVVERGTTLSEEGTKVVHLEIWKVSINDEERAFTNTCKDGDSAIVKGQLGVLRNK